VRIVATHNEPKGMCSCKNSLSITFLFFDVLDTMPVELTFAMCGSAQRNQGQVADAADRVRDAHDDAHPGGACAHQKNPYEQVQEHAAGAEVGAADRTGRHSQCAAVCCSVLQGEHEKLTHQIAQKIAQQIAQVDILNVLQCVVV